MWRWTKRWADWLRNDMLPLTRARRGGHAVIFQYDAGGQPHHELPIPWTAETVTLEIQLRLPPAVRRKTDFALRFPNTPLVLPEAIRPDSGDRYRIVFRFPLPHNTVAGELLWKHRQLASVTVPVLTKAACLANLAIHHPTVAIRVAGQGVSAKACVSSQCRGMIASAMLRAPHSLAPIPELGISVEFRNDRTGRTYVVPMTLSAEQRGARETVITAVCPTIPKRPGTWTVAWRVDNQEFARRQVEVIPAWRFEDSIKVVDTRFMVSDKSGGLRSVRQPPPSGTVDCVGPCFLIASTEPGAVGTCRLRVLAVTSGEHSPLPWMEQEMVVTDAPSLFAPGLVDVAELARVGGFELELNGRTLATISLSPVPPATLTAEGGFKPPPDFTWTAAAEDELMERLGRLGQG